MANRGFGKWTKKTVKGLGKMTAADFKKKKEVSKPKGRHLTKDGRQNFCAECVKRGLPCPVPEYKPFIETLGRKHSIDFAFFLGEKKLALEVEGWGHRTTARYNSDLFKYNELSQHGFMIYRRKPKELYLEETYNYIRKFFNL